MGSRPDSELINRLGGSGVVAKALGFRVNRVSNWHRDGIPHQQRGRIAQLAQAKGEALPAGFLPEGLVTAPADGGTA